MAPDADPGWKSLGDVASIGITLVVATVIGLGAGYYGDRWLGTSPWLTLLGLGFGIAAGFVNLFRSVKAAERKLDEPDGK
jgi:ATP synthase protein I